MPPITTKKAQPVEAVPVNIEKWVYGGEGLGRIDGQVVLVPFVLPGERVSVRSARVKTGLLRGSATEVLEPSPLRVNPGCEYFATCGGCHYQQSQYDYQLEQKRAILRETLQRLGGVNFEHDIQCIGSPPWNYRNRSQLHFADGKAGFHQAGSHDLCAIDHCPISSPLLNQAIASLGHAVLKPEWPAFLRSLELFTNETELQLTVADTTRPVAARFFEWCATFLPPLVPGALTYTAVGHPFRVSRGSFFQVNRFLIDDLVSEVIAGATGAHAVDLYAGVGLFTLPLARSFERVDAIERGGPAYRDLEWNATQWGTEIRTTKSSAEEFLRSLDTPPDLIVADPPRAGLGRETTEELLRLAPAAMKIVSCDPATLARDLRKLLPAYSMERITLVDLFPQTYHFETVVHLARR
jgi:23S rRNA (uracil1939-C5)-methyltransferase